MNRIAEIRTLRGMSQAELAEAAGTSNVQISRLENGDRKLNEDWAVKIAKALKVQPGDLMPVITDGSVPLPQDISQYELTVLATSISFFMEMHTQYDGESCERLGMAAVKLFQMARDDQSEHPFFDRQALKDRLRLDQSTSGDEDK